MRRLAVSPHPLRHSRKSPFNGLFRSALGTQGLAHRRPMKNLQQLVNDYLGKLGRSAGVDGLDDLA